MSNRYSHRDRGPDAGGLIVGVRVSVAEMQALDGARGDIARAEYLRRFGLPGVSAKKRSVVQAHTDLLEALNRVQVACDEAQASCETIASELESS